MKFKAKSHFITTLLKYGINKSAVFDITDTLWPEKITTNTIETVLTGEITTHTHPGVGGLSQQQIEGLI